MSLRDYYLTDELADYQETPIINMRGRGNIRGMRMPVQPQVQEQTKTAEEAEMEKALPKVTTTVLKPTALRVTMYVDVMRLKSQAEATAIAAAEQEHLKATATDIDGDGTLDIDEKGNTLPGASMDQYGNKLDPATGKIIQQ